MKLTNKTIKKKISLKKYYALLYHKNRWGGVHGLQRSTESHGDRMHWLQQIVFVRVRPLSWMLALAEASDTIFKQKLEHNIKSHLKEINSQQTIFLPFCCSFFVASLSFSLVFHSVSVFPFIPALVITLMKCETVKQGRWTDNRSGMHLLLRLEFCSVSFSSSSRPHSTRTAAIWPA